MWGANLGYRIAAMVIKAAPLETKPLIFCANDGFVCV